MHNSIFDDTVAIEVMRRYYEWKADLVRPHVGSRILEIGCGTGSLLEKLRPRELLAGIDNDAECIARARERFGASPEMRFEEMDAGRPGFAGALRPMRLDSVLFASCLEMIGDPAGALKEAASIPGPGGRVVVLAAALKSLSGELDRALFQRRFARDELEDLMSAAGLSVRKARYVNFLGAAGWWWDSRVVGRRRIGRTDYRMRDLAVPLARLLDAATGPPVGRWILAVGRKA